MGFGVSGFAVHGFDSMKRERENWREDGIWDYYCALRDQAARGV